MPGLLLFIADIGAFGRATIVAKEDRISRNMRQRRAYFIANLSHRLNEIPRRTGHFLF